MLRNPAYLVRSPVFHVPGRLPRPIPIFSFARTRPPLLGGVIAEPGIYCGYYWAFLLLLARGFGFYIHFLHSEDAKFGISVYFCMILLISDTIFSGRVQSRTGFFNQLYRAPFGSNFSEFFMIRKVLLVVDDFLDN